MNTHRLLPLASAALVLLLASCTTVIVKTNADPQADFSKYQTYRLSPTPAPGSHPLYPESFATLQSSLDSGLAAKGLHKTAKPSFVIYYHSAVERETSVFMFPNCGQQYNGYGMPLPVMSQFKEGTLVLDFVDTSTNRMFWQGKANGLLGSRKENQKEIADAVREMLESFPPRR